MLDRSVLPELAALSAPVPAHPATAEVALAGLVGGVAAVGLAVVVLRLLTCLALVVAARVWRALPARPGSRRRNHAADLERRALRIAPRLGRVLLAGSLGTGLLLGAGPVGGAAATSVPGTRPAPAAAPVPELDRLVRLSAHGPPTERLPASEPAPRQRTVQPGDSLWSIAAQDLREQAGGAEPRAAEVAAHWPRWYAANRTAIGPDPALLQPGTELDPPAAPKETR